MRPHTHTHTVRESLPDIKRQEDKGPTFPGDTYGCSANAGICHCLVWCDVPTSLPGVYCSPAPSHICNVGKKKWRTFVKSPFHKAGIVERSQDQNDNVDSGYCLPTGSPAAAVHSTDLQPLRGLHCVCATLVPYTCAGAY